MDSMKPFVFMLVLFTGLPASIWAQEAAPTSVDFKGHLIGEGVADFLRIEPEAQQEADVCRDRPTRHNCDRLIAALNANGRAEVSTSGAINFVLDGGRLVKLTMLVDKPMDVAALDLRDKFGPQTKAVMLSSKNDSGAKWINWLHIWDTRALYMSLYQDNNPSLQDHRLLLIVESHAEHVLDDLDSSKQQSSLASTSAPKN
jgi:hypothetical protein